MKQPAVYILASKRNGTLYVGVTSNLASRIEAHRLDVADGFTRKYGVKTLVYFEVHAEMYEAIQREKRIKKWNRAWKIELIERATLSGRISPIRRVEAGSPLSRGRRCRLLLF